ILGMSAALSGCATVRDAPPVAVTPSGRPEAIFEGKSPEQVSGMIASSCADRGHVVVTSSPNKVVRQGDMTAMQSALTQLLIGNSYSTPPALFFEFNLFAVGPNTRVQAREWVETTMAFGQKRSEELNNRAQFNQTEQALLSL